jgi:hypothetical protein
MHNNAEERHTNGLAGLNSRIFAAPLFCFQPLKIGARLAVGTARTRVASAPEVPTPGA